jgi:hypothetical protein
MRNFKKEIRIAWIMWPVIIAIELVLFVVFLKRPFLPALALFSVMVSIPMIAVLIGLKRQQKKADKLKRKH